MDDEFKDLQKLLRLKRYEQPPEGYFDDFLVEFQRRQRTAVLQRSRSRQLLDRANELFERIFPRPALGYGLGAAAAVTVAATVSVKMLAPSPSGHTMMAASPVSTNRILTANPAATTPSYFTFAIQPSSTPEPRAFEAQKLTLPTDSQSPRYILDARPVSYDQPFNF